MSELNFPKHEEITDDIQPFFSSPNSKQRAIEIPDDCDFIPKTPICNEKKLKKKVKRKKNIKTSENHHKGGISIDLEKKCVIDSTRTGSFDFNKPYVYHSLEEVLNYKENSLPKNNNIHLIGIFNFEQQKLVLNSIGKNETVVLDFNLTEKIPKEGDTISVFGSLEFTENIPVFVVRFFRHEVEITVNKYIENLKILRNFIPTVYFRTIQCSSHIGK